MAAGAFLPTFLRSLPVACEAARYARELHAGQQRDSDRAPFVLHPFEVAFLLENAGYPEVVVVVGVLHEALEDGGADLREIRVRFGGEVAAAVQALSEDPSIESFAQRKAALRRQIAGFGGIALAVDAADKIAKVRELRLRIHDDAGLLAAGEGRLRLEHYHATLEMLESCEPDEAIAPLVGQLRFELEALGHLPPESHHDTRAGVPPH